MQDLLPKRPEPPQPSSLMAINGLSVPAQTGKKQTKGKSKKATKFQPQVVASVRSYTELENKWVPPLPPAPFTAYRLSSYDARRIIHPGANGDPWWDMPQLISQVHFSCLPSIF
jgi:hypothetical protein